MTDLKRLACPAAEARSQTALGAEPRARRRVGTAAGLVLALALAAASGAGSAVAQTPAPTPAPAQAPAAPVLPDAANVPPSIRSDGELLRDAADRDAFEVDVSRLAVERAAGDPVKAFAREVIVDAERRAEARRALSVAPSAPPAVGEDPLRADQKERLKGTSGAEFDRVYLQMIAGSQEAALRKFEVYANEGQAAAVKAHATEQVNAIRARLTRIEALSKR